MTTATATPLESGTTTVDLTHATRDTRRRLPSVLALAQATGGLYAENLAGMSVPAALAAAGLDFTVAMHGPLSVPVDGVLVEGLPKWRATVAHWPEPIDKQDTQKPPTLLGVVSERYPVVQPVQAAEFGQAVLDEAGGNIVAVCAYGEPRGSRMVMAFKLPDGLMIGGADPHDLYLFVGNSWNRQTSLWGCVAPIRIACTNQAAATFGSLANRFTIPHRGDMEWKVTDVRATLKITGTFAEAYAAAADQLLAEPMVGREVDAFLEELFGTPKSVKTERGEQSWAERRRAVASIIRDGEFNEYGRGTRYAAYQGVVEWIDHVMPATTPVKRFARLVDGGPTEQLKTRAADLLLAGL
jgi:hypothetical protein